MESTVRGLLRTALKQTIDILDCLPIGERRPSSSTSVSTHQDETSPLRRNQDTPPSATTVESEMVLETGQPAHDDHSLITEGIEGPPRFTDGPPKVTTASDDDARTCFALLITERMIEAHNDLAFADNDRKAKEALLQKIREKERKFERLIREAESSQQPSPGNDEGERISTDTSKVCSKLEELKDRKRLVQAEIEALKDNVDSCRTMIQRMSQRAMEQANLLKTIELQQIAEILDDEDEDEEGSDQGEDLDINMEVPDGKPVEPIVSEEEKALRDAQRDFAQAEQVLCQAQADFDRKEWRYESELAEYEAAFAAGDTDWSRSQFDRRAILISQDLTRDLINAEYAYDDARDHGERIGAFDNGWGQESYYGDSEHTEQSLGADQVPEGGFPSTLSAATQNSIQTWAAKVVEPEEDDAVEPIDVDDWDSMPVGLSDSVSCVDYSPLARRMVEWNNWCDKHRREWRPQEVAEEDVWTAGHSPVSRRMSCSL